MDNFDKFDSLDILLNKESTLKEHLECQLHDRDGYITGFIVATTIYKARLSTIKKARILVASIMRDDKPFSKYLLGLPDYDFDTVFKVCDILDSRRLYNQLEKKLERLKNPKKINVHKTVMQNTKTLYEDLPVSLTKSKIKFIIQNWVNRLTEKELEKYALECLTSKNCTKWKKLIDIMHLRGDDFPNSCSWFPSYIMTNEYPNYGIVHDCYHIHKDNILDTTSKYMLPLSFIMSEFSNILSDEVKVVIASYEDLHTLILNWETVYTPDVEKVVLARLEKGEKVDFPYGELVKQIQKINLKDKSDKSDKLDKSSVLKEMLIKSADQQLKEYNLDMEAPVVVFGDASASMQIAVRTSSILMSILGSICDAKMHLFRDKDEVINGVPQNVQEVINVGEGYKAHSCTAPVACLYPYYENKEVVKTFIIVTDEEENTDFTRKWIKPTDDTSFAGIFKRYYDEVYPAKLVFVSFLNNTDEGQMVRALRGIMPSLESEGKLVQFRFHQTKPDLRKFDTMLNSLASEIGDIDKVVNTVKSNLESILNGSDLDQMINQCGGENEDDVHIYI